MRQSRLGQWVEGDRPETLASRSSIHDRLPESFTKPTEIGLAEMANAATRRGADMSKTKKPKDQKTKARIEEDQGAD